MGSSDFNPLVVFIISNLDQKNDMFKCLRSLSQIYYPTKSFFTVEGLFNSAGIN